MRQAKRSQRQNGQCVTLFLAASALALALLAWPREPASARPVQDARESLPPVAVAPNPLVPGPIELYLGSKEPWAADTEVVSATAALAIDKVEAVGTATLRAVGTLEPGPAEVELVVRTARQESRLVLAVGSPVEPLTLAANLPEEALARGSIETSSPHFVYAFRPADGVDVAALWILNEATGERLGREEPFAKETSLEDPERVAADTDGDEVLDVESPPETGVPPDFIGVRLSPGPNPLSIATTDRQGRTRLEAFLVTYVP